MEFPQYLCALDAFAFPKLLVVCCVLWKKWVCFYQYFAEGGGKAKSLLQLLLCDLLVAFASWRRTIHMPFVCFLQHPSRPSGQGVIAFQSWGYTFFQAVMDLAWKGLLAVNLIPGLGRRRTLLHSITLNVSFPRCFWWPDLAKGPGSYCPKRAFTASRQACRDCFATRHPEQYLPHQEADWDHSKSSMHLITSHHTLHLQKVWGYSVAIPSQYKPSQRWPQHILQGRLQ